MQLCSGSDAAEGSLDQERAVASAAAAEASGPWHYNAPRVMMMLLVMLMMLIMMLMLASGFSIALVMMTTVVASRP